MILVLYVLSFVLFMLATFNVPARFNLIAAGLAAFTLSFITPLLH